MDRIERLVDSIISNVVEVMADAAVDVDVFVKTTYCNEELCLKKSAELQHQH